MFERPYAVLWENSQPSFYCMREPEFSRSPRCQRPVDPLIVALENGIVVQIQYYVKECSKRKGGPSLNIECCCMKYYMRYVEYKNSDFIRLSDKTDYRCRTPVILSPFWSLWKWSRKSLSGSQLWFMKEDKWTHIICRVGPPSMRFATFIRYNVAGGW